MKTVWGLDQKLRNIGRLSSQEPAEPPMANGESKSRANEIKRGKNGKTPDHATDLTAGIGRAADGAALGRRPWSFFTKYGDVKLGKPAVHIDPLDSNQERRSRP